MEQKNEGLDEIHNFYGWIRDYWGELSKSPQGLTTNILNFGYWKEECPDLFTAQNNFFDLVASMVGYQAADKKGVEIGCGIGGFAVRMLRKNPASLTCYDLLEEHLEQTRAYAKREGVENNLTTVEGSSMDMNNFAANSLDFAYCIESSFHYDEKQRFFHEVYRSLKPDSVFVIADISCEANEKITFKSGNHFSSKQELNDFIRQAKFEIIDYIDIGNDVYQPLYQFIKQYNLIHSSQKKNKVARYWERVLSNYSSLNEKGLMGYQVYQLRKHESLS